VQRMILFAAIATLVVASATAASAAPRMPIGFYDDNSFRWVPDINKNLLAAQNAGSSVIHVTADWSQIAPTRPAVPENGDDPVYRIGDLDALVGSAPRYGLQVMINISGAPKWANGGQASNHPPTSLSTLTTFAHMLARRYNGYSKHGWVGRWSVWNEPNLELFLTPQFSGTKIVSPAAYAKIYLAARAGIKSGNPQALVAVGETSNRGRDKPVPGVSGSVAPATFARLLAQAAPNLPFDAYAQHPYPTDPFLGPAQKVAWPNVTMTRITQFGESLEKWFHRRVPIWITEYGEQTTPEYPSGGVSYSKQAADAKLALQMSAANPYVEMFIWFILRDSSSQTWFSGLEKKSGAKKPSYSAFAGQAKQIVGQTVYVSPGKPVSVALAIPFLADHDAPGATVGITYKVYDGKKLVVVGQPRGTISSDQTVTFAVKLSPEKGKSYSMTTLVNDKHGQTEQHVVALVPPPT
jgi:Cellulase (glycosyl hydrolase family 5)